MKKEIKYDKIVRDFIPSIIENTGKIAETRVLNKDEAINYLNKKLSEELDEYLESSDLEELADLLEVIHGLLYHKGLSFEDLEQLRLKKKQKRGGFEDGILLTKVTETN